MIQDKFTWTHHFYNTEANAPDNCYKANSLHYEYNSTWIYLPTQEMK